MSKGGKPFFQAECEAETVCLCFIHGEKGCDFFGGDEPMVILFEPFDKFLLCF